MAETSAADTGPRKKSWIVILAEAGATADEVNDIITTRRALRDESAKLLTDGYPAEEVPFVRAISAYLRARMPEDRPDVVVYVNRRIHEWAQKLKNDGKEPTTYRYFHAVAGSTPPPAIKYKESPDLPGDDSVFVLLDAIDAEMVAQGLITADEVIDSRIAVEE